jgi:hypothetical protein
MGAVVYVLPIVLIVLLAVVAAAWSPVFAVVVAALLFVAFLAYAGLRPPAGEKIEPSSGRAGVGEDDVLLRRGEPDR